MKKTIKFSNGQSRYILENLSGLIENQNEKIQRTGTWMEADKRDFIHEVDILARGFAGRKRRFVLGCLSGFIGNQSNPIEPKLVWLVASCTSNMIGEVAALSAKYRQDIVTNVTTTLADHTVWEVSSFEMARELVEKFPCFLVFNVEW